MSLEVDNLLRCMVQFYTCLRNCHSESGLEKSAFGFQTEVLEPYFHFKKEVQNLVPSYHWGTEHRLIVLVRYSTPAVNTSMYFSIPYNHSECAVTLCRAG